MSERDVSIGDYMVIEEDSGEGTVFKEDEPGHIHEAGTFDEAVEWVRKKILEDG